MTTYEDLAEAGRAVGKVCAIDRMLSDIEGLGKTHRAAGPLNGGYLQALADMTECLSKYHFEPAEPLK